MPSATAPQTLNRYTYANNNPILYTDPSGHFGFKSIKKAFKKTENFIFENRKYITLWHSVPTDYLLTQKTIGPYVRIVGTAVAAYYGGPWAAAGAQAYQTRLLGGSTEQAAIAGGVGLVSSYAGGAGFAAASIGATSIIDAVNNYYADLNTQATGALTVNKGEIGGGGTLEAKARRPFNNGSNIFELPGTLEEFNSTKSTIIQSGANRSEFHQRFYDNHS